MQEFALTSCIPSGGTNMFFSQKLMIFNVYPSCSICFFGGKESDSAANTIFEKNMHRITGLCILSVERQIFNSKAILRQVGSNYTLTIYFVFGPIQNYRYLISYPLNLRTERTTN